MRREKGEGVELAAGCRWAAGIGALVVAASLAGCGGGGGGDGSTVVTPPSGNSPQPRGTGSIRVTVTDVVGEAVAGAEVYVSATNTTLLTGADGTVQFDDVPTGGSRVCASHRVRGSTCSTPDLAMVQKDKLLEVSRQLEVYEGPTVSVLQATVDPGGVSADGRNLDLTVRVAVTQGREGSSWFLEEWGLGVAGCDARTGAELAELGPRCIAGVRGTDASYSFGELKDAGIVRTVASQPRSSAVGLLIDQSLAADLSPAGANEPRLFAAKVFADSLLPDVPLVLAAFASDLAMGNASLLPRRPVTFFPVESPGFVRSQPEAFKTLDDLAGMVGGGAPLYEAITAAIEFMASRALPGSVPTLVVLADGTDSDCGTAAQCAQWRRTVVQRAQQAGVRLFLVGNDSDTHCGREPWDDEDRYYCETAIAAEAPLWELAALGGMPLAVGSGPKYSHSPHSQLELVKQWLSGSMQVQDIGVRLVSDAEGAFAPGAIVTGGLWGVNESFCPWDCMYHALPFRVQVPQGAP